MARPYWWWHGSDLQDFFERVMELGPENVRIEFHPDDELLYIKQVDADGVVIQSEHEGGDDPYNFANKCPPKCGDDDG